jgi:hypothetical protein
MFTQVSLHPLCRKTQGLTATDPIPGREALLQLAAAPVILTVDRTVIGCCAVSQTLAIDINDDAKSSAKVQNHPGGVL